MAPAVLDSTDVVSDDDADAEAGALVPVYETRFSTGRVRIVQKDTKQDDCGVFSDLEATTM